MRASTRCLAIYISLSLPLLSHRYLAISPRSPHDLPHDLPISPHISPSKPPFSLGRPCAGCILTQVQAIRTILIEEGFGDYNEKAFDDIRNFEEVRAISVLSPCYLRAISVLSPCSPNSTPLVSSSLPRRSGSGWTMCSWKLSIPTPNTTTTPSPHASEAP